MKSNVFVGIASIVALIYGSANAQQPAQTSPQQPMTPSELISSGRTNIATADFLAKMGQYQAQTGMLMEQKAAKDAWWKNYVVGVDKQMKDLNDRLNNPSIMHHPPQSFPMSHEQLQDRLKTGR